MFETFKNRLELIGTLTTVTALRISAGRSTEPIGSDLPVIKDALGRPLIPGSSFKGALRSRLESFLRGINPSFAANPAVESEWSITPSRMSGFKDSIKNLKQEEKEGRLNNFIFTNTDLVSQLFGSPWLASKFQVRDLTVLPEDWFGQYQERDGVAIDRDTETVANGKLYDFQIVPAGTSFEFKAVVENADDWELGLLMIGLHQFETEQIPLGGGRSRGLGVVCLKIDRMWWFDYPEDKPEQLLDYLKRLVQGDKDYYLCSPERTEALRNKWIEELIKHLKKKMPASAASPSRS
jgi:CRISPR-associated RAMP protein (TIGR02581 family)